MSFCAVLADQEADEALCRVVLAARLEHGAPETFTIEPASRAGK